MPTVIKLDAEKTDAARAPGPGTTASKGIPVAAICIGAVVLIILAVAVIVGMRGGAPPEAPPVEMAPAHPVGPGTPASPAVAPGGQMGRYVPPAGAYAPTGPGGKVPGVTTGGPTDKDPYGGARENR